MLSANFVIILGIGKNSNYFCGSVMLISVVLALVREAWKWGKFFRLGGSFIAPSLDYNRSLTYQIFKLRTFPLLKRVEN